MYIESYIGSVLHQDHLFLDPVLDCIHHRGVQSRRARLSASVNRHQVPVRDRHDKCVRAADHLDPSPLQLVHHS